MCLVTMGHRFLYFFLLSVNLVPGSFFGAFNAVNVRVLTCWWALTTFTGVSSIPSNLLSVPKLSPSFSKKSVPNDFYVDTPSHVSFST